MSCSTCDAALRAALGIAAACRVPLVGRTVGPHEAAVWMSMQRATELLAAEAWRVQRECQP